MGERDRAGPGQVRPAADQRRDRRGVVRRLQRCAADQPGRLAQRAGHRVHRADLERGGVVERRQQAGQPLGEHRLARAGRALQEHVVPARGRDLDGALGERLPRDVAQVRAASSRRRPAARRARAAAAGRRCAPRSPRAGRRRSARPCPARAPPRRRSPAATTTRRDAGRRAAPPPTAAPRAPAAAARPARVRRARRCGRARPDGSGPWSPSSATAIARSKREPDLRRSAGSSATVARRFGHSAPALHDRRPDPVAGFQHRGVRQARSGRRPGCPSERSASISTGRACTPASATPERPRQRHQNAPRRCSTCGRRLGAQHADDVEADLRPVPVVLRRASASPAGGCGPPSPGAPPPPAGRTTRWCVSSPRRRRARRPRRRSGRARRRGSASCARAP